VINITKDFRFIIWTVVAWWCNVRTSDSRSNGHGFDSVLGC